MNNITKAAGILLALGTITSLIMVHILSGKVSRLTDEVRATTEAITAMKESGIQEAVIDTINQIIASQQAAQQQQPQP